MIVNLSKGEVVNLSKESTNLEKIVLGLGWQGVNGRSLDLDSYVALLDSQGKPLDFIHFNKLRGEGVVHHGDDLTGGGSANHVNEQITIDLKKLNTEVKSIITGLFIYSGANNLGQVDHAFIKLTDQSGKDLIFYDIKQNFEDDRSLIVGEFKLANNEWRFKAVGKGTSQTYREIKMKYTRDTSTPREIEITSSEPRRRSFLDRLFGR